MLRVRLIRPGQWRCHRTEKNPGQQSFDCASESRSSYRRTELLRLHPGCVELRIVGLVRSLRVNPARRVKRGVATS